MQPSSKYASTEKTYAGGFVYKETDNIFSDIYALDDPIDMSVSYTTPINSNFNKVNMGGWNSSSAAAYVNKRQRFRKEWTTSGGGKAYSNVNGLAVSKSPFTSTGNVTVVFSNGVGAKYYFGKSAQGTATIGSFGRKLITDFEVNKVIFKYSVTGWTKAEFDSYKENGTLADSHNISITDFVANPSNYLVRTFEAVPVAYWDGSTWKSNSLSNSPNIHINFLIDTDKVSGICNIQKHHYDNATGTTSYGGYNFSVYNSTSGNTTEIASLIRGAVVSELQNVGSGMGGFVLDSVTNPLELEPDLSLDEMTNMCDTGVQGAGDTLPAHDVSWCSALTILKYDQYTLSYDVGSSGQTHFSRYNMYICTGMKGEYVDKMFAYAGVYFYTGSLQELLDSGATPTNLKVTGMRLGEMNSAGQTTGNWITPTQMDDYVGPNKDGSIIHPDYNPTPPAPGPGPYDDDPWHGINFSGVGVGGAGAFAKCYYMTSTELANLRSWMNSINVPEGFDPMQQIIGLSQVPVALSGSGPENVVFVNSSAVYDPGVTTRAVDTGVATQQAMGTPISYYLGSVNISRRMQQRGEPYLDYDCQIELYLPLIGMFSLDTQAVMGRTISAYAVLDPVSGTLAAYAYVSKDGQNLPVAYGSTTIGVDLPISAQQLSVSRAALKQANAQLGASLLSGALTMLAAASSSGRASGSGAKTSTGSSGLSAAGIREAGSDYMKASQVGNVFGDFMNWGRTIRQLSYGNNTAIAGSFGGSTAQWAYPFTPYVKIIRPRFEKPSNYAHSQGVPCVQTKTIGSCTGFIQCIGADVSGITGATDLELQAIQAALSNGIYAGGGQ